MIITHENNRGKPNLNNMKAGDQTKVRFDILISIVRRSCNYWPILKYFLQFYIKGLIFFFRFSGLCCWRLLDGFIKNQTYVASIGLFKRPFMRETETRRDQTATKSTRCLAHHGLGRHLGLQTCLHLVLLQQLPNLAWGAIPNSPSKLLLTILCIVSWDL